MTLGLLPARPTLACILEGLTRMVRSSWLHLDIRMARIDGNTPAKPMDAPASMLKSSGFFIARHNALGHLISEVVL